MLFLLPGLLVSLVLGDPLSSEENEHLQATCGQRSFRRGRSVRLNSMNTKPSNRNEAPFTVLIRTSYRNSTIEKRLHYSMNHCTGTLISSRHILTAAHCLMNNIDAFCDRQEILDYTPYFDMNGVKYLEKLDYFLIVAPGKCDKSGCDTVLKSKVVLPKRAYIPKNWIRNFCKDKGKLRGDVAVIELQEDVTFTKSLQPACLHDKRVKAGSALTIYGYGMTQSNLPSSSGTMRKHKTMTLSREECRRNYKPPRDSSAFYTYPDGTLRFLEDEICSTHPKAMACQIDSGSGQVLIQDGKVYVAAVASYGPPCKPEAKKLRDTSAEIFLHLDWISAATGIYPLGSTRHSFPERLRKKYVSMELAKNFSLIELGKKSY